MKALTREHQHLLDLLAVEGPSGREKQVAALIRKKFRAAGIPAEWMKEDAAHRRIGRGFEQGNLIIKFPGTVRAPRILFSAHMDTVPLCQGAVPVIRGGRVVAQNSTGLGGDDRAACAALVSLGEALVEEKIPHPPVTFLFVVGEENGLHGSRHVRFSDLGRPVMGFNLDGEFPQTLYIGAMGAYRWECEITGKSAHAGLNPEKGISAGLIAAEAISSLQRAGFFGRIEQGNRHGTLNVGGLHGGEASNQVMDHLRVFGECRSHSPAFLEKIITVCEQAFHAATRQVKDDRGECGRVVFTKQNDYCAFRLKKSEPCVKAAMRAVRAAGLEPELIAVNAGLDANNFNQKGFPCVTLGAGTHNFHSTEEYVELGEFDTCCRILREIIAQAC